MCGIFCSVYRCSSAKHPICSNATLERLGRRGPDSQQFLHRKVTDSWEIEFLATVLYLRGPEIIFQPVEDEQGNILLWNGEIFNGLEVTCEANDTLLVSAALAEAVTEDLLLQIIKTIHGPWALIYWQNSTQKLWFGRDVLGRRSLLWNRPSHPNQLVISSVMPKEDQTEVWEEVPAIGLFCLDLNTAGSNDETSLKLYPWLKQVSCESAEALSCQALTRVLSSQYREWAVVEEDHQLEPPFTTQLNKSLPADDMVAIVPTTVDPTIMSKEYSLIVHQFLDVLAESVRVRIQAQPKLCEDCLKSWKHSKSVKCTDLQRRKSNEKTTSLKDLSSDGGKDSLKHYLPCKHSKIGVLFSGGVDSCVLAALADRFVPLDEPIDLLNVAFQQKLSPSKQRWNRRKPQASSDDSSAHDVQQTSADLYNVPDRISGLQGCEELRKISPNRKWNFVHINVTPEELKKEREAHVANVIAPSLTVLDDSIGCAVWFAARGAGCITENGEEKFYATPARVLLVGMGADEQLCGYSRHRVKFNTCGWKGLIEEIDVEINRISSRNLGRDDRVISDHGRESRLPFLEENVVSFLNGLPICYKANLTLPRGIGEKILLRVAASLLGLEKTATLAKRAIQFGSRIAKAEDKCEKGSDVCARLKI